MIFGTRHPAKVPASLGVVASLALLALVLLPSCEGPPDEGTVGLDCRDGVDNDRDGRVDCEDDGCFASPDCEGVGVSSFPGLLEDAELCDAGDEAFVRRVVPQLWGRRPHSIVEVELLLEIIEQSDRATLVRSMMRADAFKIRWRDALLDMLQVNRVGERRPRCMDDPTALTGEGPGLAQHVLDNPPGGAPYAPDWRLLDLMDSSFALDDVSPVFLATLFTRLASKIINLDNPGANLAWRGTYGDLFQRTFLSRRMDCLQCHNSEFSVTGSFDPDLDRTWEVPALFELALFGDSIGRPTKELSAFFRVEGVLSMEFIPEGVTPTLFWDYGQGMNPWGMSGECGEFVPRDDIEPDPEGWEGYLIESVADRPSIWHVEERLRAGFDKIRLDGMQVADDGTIDGERALAWMVAMSVAEKTWVELTSKRITAPHFLPRNRYQRDLLIYLTETFVDAGFSLRELIEASVLHPYFNSGTPDQCDDLSSPYYMAPIFDPWVADYEVPELRLNSVGDFVTRLPPRVLLGSVVSALGWESIDSRLYTGFPTDGEEQGVTVLPALDFQLDVGVFLLDGERGFRSSNFQESLAWEEALGTCSEAYLADGAAIGEDWIDRLLAQVPETTTLDTLALALKDRLLAEPRWDGEEEEELAEALLGVSLDTAIGSTAEGEAGLRRLCGAWLASPDFQLEGAPGPELAGVTVPLTVVGSSRVELCEELATVLFPGDVGLCDEVGHLTVPEGGGSDAVSDDDDDTAEGDDDTADGDDDTAAGDDDDATTGDDDTAPPDIAPQGISMVGIPSGSFPMGCAEGKSGCGTDESPVHSVTLTHAFWMSATEVTQGQWQALMGNNPSPFVSCGSDCPVDSITWLEALSFANALSAAEGLAECYSVVGDSVSINSSTGSPYDCTGYRLPTEAEWEYAARAGAESLYAGGNEAADVAWHSGNSGGASHPVGTRQPNAWGLYDMSGNVWEWIWDLYDSDYYDVSPGTNPEGPSSGSVRVIRGGSWDDDSSCVTVCNRDSYGDPNQQSDFLGLRVTRTSPTSEAQAQ